MADKKNKSKTKDPYLDRNEFKKGFYNQPDKPPITADTLYGTDRDIIRNEAIKQNSGSVISKSERDIIRNEALKGSVGEAMSESEFERLKSITPEQYQEDRANPYSKGSYKDGGEIHLTGKDKNYIKDLIK